MKSEQIAPILRKMLEQAMAPFDRKQVREFAFQQLERCLCSKWSQARLRRQNERFPVLAYGPVELEVAEELESHKLTRLVTVVAEESLLSMEAAGIESLNRLAWVRLLAVAHLLMDSYLRSESNHYGIVPAITNIDSMYSITIEHACKEPVERHLTTQTMQINSVTTRPFVEPRLEGGSKRAGGGVLAWSCHRVPASEFDRSVDVHGC